MRTEPERIELTEKGGKGWLMFSLIPAALAGAALMWFAFYIGIIDWRTTQRIEGRMDNRVGVHGELTAPFDLIIRQSGCMKITRAFLDAGNLTAYVKNDCHVDSDYWELHWSEVAPDETLEVSHKLKNDSRTVKVIAWAKHGLD